ncbi:MAG: hypothetical protein ACOYYS_11520 [Chloroflexota bacterium]
MTAPMAPTPATENAMNAEFIQQYAHTWRVFERLVNGFDDEAWLRTGRKATIPVRLAFHILKATRYYTEDTTTVSFASGKSFEINCETAGEEELPSRADIVACIRELREKTACWLAGIDLAAKNEAFGWAGETKLGVALFLLRHNLFHIGELSSLLNESRHGDVEDHYVKAL